MHNLYHKLVVVSVCTTLSFMWGANKKAEAATLVLPTTSFSIEGISYSTGQNSTGQTILRGSNLEKKGNFYGPLDILETRAFSEFNISNLSLPPNTTISRASLWLGFLDVDIIYRNLYVDIFGYTGNGRPDLSDFDAGVELDRVDAFNPRRNVPIHVVNVDVTQFVKALISNEDAFAGFGFRIENSFANYGRARIYNPDLPSLVIETVDVAEPVPEPTTILGSAIALGLGGWLKQKKLSRQNKTAP